MASLVASVRQSGKTARRPGEIVASEGEVGQVADLSHFALAGASGCYFGGAGGAVGGAGTGGSGGCILGNIAGIGTPPKAIPPGSRRSGDMQHKHIVFK